MVAAAHKRVRTLTMLGYSSANVYGENELGGLHVLYVLDDSPEVYDLPESPKLATTSMVEKWLTGIATAGIVAALPLWFLFRLSLIHI